MSSSDLPFVSVIVPAYNDAARVGKCIEALSGQTYPPDRFEVLVIDNGSTDGTREVIMKYPVKLLVENKIQSSYAARNKGVLGARGEVVAFTDSDCIPAPDWIMKGVTNLLRTPGCGLVGGRIDIFFEDPGAPTAVELYDSVTNFRQKDDIERHWFGSTANVFTYRSVFDHVGLFDDSLRSGGDNEWGKRVYSHGYSQIYAPDTVVKHPARKTFGQLYGRITRLIGGNFDQMKNNRSRVIENLKYLFRSLRNLAAISVRTVMGKYASEDLKGIGRKCRFVLVCFCVEVFRNYERNRLLLGGRPKR